jgi:phenylalanyl-tRNA synthetase alpha subunit
VNTLGIPQAHPARKEKGTYIIHALYGGVEVTLLFPKKGNALMVFPKEGSSTLLHSTTTELPVPMASFSFPKTHHSHISLFPEVIEQ